MWRSTLICLKKSFSNFLQNEKKKLNLLFTRIKSILLFNTKVYYKPISSSAEHSSRSVKWPDNSSKGRRRHVGVQGLGESGAIDILDEKGQKHKKLVNSQLMKAFSTERIRQVSITYRRRTDIDTRKGRTTAVGRVPVHSWE